MKALVWPVAVYGCESWTLRKNEEFNLFLLAPCPVGLLLNT